MTELVKVWKMKCQIEDGNVYLFYAYNESWAYKYITDMYRRCQEKGWKFYVILEPTEVEITPQQYIDNEE